MNSCKPSMIGSKSGSKSGNGPAETRMKWAQLCEMERSGHPIAWEWRRSEARKCAAAEGRRVFLRRANPTGCGPASTSARTDLGILDFGRYPGYFGNRYRAKYY